ncbi:MAG: hypothetical protein PHE59_01785 [Patescibacteria group bacterium]|nr:hypothetical protein [Patescibacteria group bacterium]MDD5164539.1 hypothetical protein [Patescibacteria group bacterium]MDD5534719.1 hypothetical protein [Patescibacteria group bacterium]
MKEKTESVIAVSASEFGKFGCPHCGFRSGSIRIQAGGSAAWKCGDEECGKICCILADGVTESSFGFGEEGYASKLQPHPRQGIPSHGRPDKKPESGGEFFRSRGIGLDHCNCFICGTHDRDEKGHTALHNIAAFVQCKEAGERIVAMFSKGAKLDYRCLEPDYVQVKIGACDSHLVNLQKLNELTKDGVITADRIKESMN